MIIILKSENVLYFKLKVSKINNYLIYYMKKLSVTIFFFVTNEPKLYFITFKILNYATINFTQFLKC